MRPWLVPLVLIAAACNAAEGPAGLSDESRRGIGLSTELDPEEKVPEEEVVGMVFEFGSHIDINDGTYEVRLIPLGATTMPEGE